MLNFIQKMFGSKNDRELKRIAPLVDEINRLEPAIKKLSDEELKAKTPYFRRSSQTGPRSTTSCRRPLPLPARLHGERSRCGPLTFRSSGEWSSTRARSPR